MGSPLQTFMKTLWHLSNAFIFKTHAQSSSIPWWQVLRGWQRNMFSVITSGLPLAVPKGNVNNQSQYSNSWLLFLEQPWHQVISYHKLKNAFPFISESNMQEKAEKISRLPQELLSQHISNSIGVTCKSPRKKAKLTHFKNHLLEELCW